MSLFGRFFTALSLLIVLLASPAAAQDKVLRVAFNELPPWKIINEQGEIGGIDIELLHLLAKEVGCRLKFVGLPFKRGLKMLEIGEIDIMVGVLKRPDREEYLHFIEPAYKESSDKAFFVLKGREGLIKNYEDLYRVRVGTELGVKYFSQFDADKRIEKYAVKSTELGLRMLEADRIDTFILTESTGDYNIAKQDKKHIIRKANFAHRKYQPVYMVLSKQSPLAHMLDDFNQAMEKLVKTGTHETLTTRFYEELTPE